MTSRIISIDEDEKVCDAVKKMTKHNIGSIVVKRDNEYVGIVTERDILKISSKENLYSPNLKIKKIMSSPLITIDGNASIGKATIIMESKGVRHLLVEDNGKIVGIITQKDVNRETLNIYMVLSSAIHSNLS
jgi:CBS domain-containing protein